MAANVDKDTYGDDEFEPTVRLWQADPPVVRVMGCVDFSGHGPIGSNTLYMLGSSRYCLACVLELAARYVELNGDRNG